MKKYLFLFLVYISVNQCIAQYGQKFSNLNKYKIVIGAGSSVYWGHGRLYGFPKSNAPDERTFAFSGAFFKTINDRFEYGIRFNHGALKGSKKGKSWGPLTVFETNFDDINLQTNISLNNNLFLREDFYTINLIAGMGATYFESVFAEYDPYIILSTIGKGGKESKDIADKQVAFYGSLGLGVHFRVSQLISIGLDNYLNVTSTKNLTGLTSTQSVKMYDSYSLHLLTISLRLGKGNKLFCPRI